MVIIAAFFVLEIFLGKGKIMKKIWTKALAYVLAVTMCLSAVNVPVYAQGSTVTEVSTETKTTSEAITEEATVSGSDAEATTEEVVSTEEATTDENDGSTWDQVTTENVFEGENYKVTFTLTSNWDAGYNANVKLENTGDSTIQNWYLRFDYNNSITNIWNAEVSSNEGNEYVIKNVGWNQDIAAGSSIEFGLSGDHSFKGFPENYELIGTSTEVTEDDYTIQYIVDGDWGTGFYGSISVTNNTDTALEDWVLEFDFDREITEIWNGVIEEHEGNHYVVRNAEYNSTIAPGENVSIGIKGCEGESGDEPRNYSLYSYVIDMEYIDLDNDGIPDEFEDMSKWIDMQDSDGDTLPDDVENWLGSNSNDVDTDQDGLTDYDERFVYFTDANLKDTDEDGAEDKWEIDNEHNPIVYDEKFTLTKEVGTYDITASVSLETKGCFVDSLVVEPVDNMILLDESVPGYMGSPFNFEIDGDFESATISFEFDESYLSEENLVPTIYYFNEESQLLEELETTVDGNRAFAQTTHFSTYVLLNKTTYEKSWAEIKTTNGIIANEVNIGFVVDTSGSMRGTKISTAKSVIRNFINEIRKNSVKTNVSLVKFSSYATVISELTDDYDSFLLNLNKLGSTGLTSIYTGLGKSLSMLVDNKDDDNLYNAIILLTDGYDEPSTTYNLYSGYVDTAVNSGINIYTVGIGTIDENLLIKLAEETGGKYYYAADSSKLYEIYEQIETEIIDYTTDSNSDGISDYYSKLLCEGKLRIGTQSNLFEGISYEKFNSNNDYDGDGIINGKEFEIRLEEYTGRVYVYLWSNPFVKDTDSDDVEDSLDDKPFDHAQGFVVYKTEKTDEELKGLNHKDRPEDYQYSDKSIDDLREMKYINWSDFFGVYTYDYVYSWKSLVKLTSMGDMQDVALDMVNHFMDGTASDYWNTTLTKSMEEHSSSKKYISSVTEIINSYIEENNGDVVGLVYNESDRTSSPLVSEMIANKVYAPVYSDKFSGLGICVDGLYGNEIEITSYKFDGQIMNIP